MKYRKRESSGQPRRPTKTGKFAKRLPIVILAVILTMTMILPSAADLSAPDPDSGLQTPEIGMDNGSGTTQTPDPDSGLQTPEIGMDNGSEVSQTQDPDRPSDEEGSEEHHPFQDVGDDQWFAPAVQYVFSHGLMNGMEKTVFAPSGSVSRGMVVTVLYRMEQSPDSTAEMPFRDVADNAYYTEAVRWAADNGIIDGYGDGLFGPSDDITREQLAKILCSYTRKMEYGIEQSAVQLDRFMDEDRISGWAEQGMKWAVGTELYRGDTEGCLLPKDSLTRSQLAQVLQRLHPRIESYRSSGDDPGESGRDNPEQADDPDDPDVSVLTASAGSRSFADNMARLMPENKNWTFSPYSLEMCLAMLTNGAKGATQAELMQVLGISDLDSYNAQTGEILEQYDSFQGVMDLETANAMWLNQDAFQGQGRFLESFSDVLQLYYRAESRTVYTSDAANQINQWASEHTHGRIEKVIDNEEWSFTTALSNAVYFKAAWDHQFLESSTFDQTFYSLNGTESDIPFMHQKNTFGYYEKDGVQALRMNYRKYSVDEKTMKMTNYCKDANFSMYFVLGGDEDGSLDLQHFLDKAEFTYRDVQVSIPKFEMTCGGGLDGQLKALGIRTAYDPVNADLTGMIDSILPGGQNLYLDSVLQRVFLQVDEEGTEAAAVTIAVEATTSLPSEEAAVFTADRPFWFAIRDNNSGWLLFTGRYIQAC